MQIQKKLLFGYLKYIQQAQVQFSSCSFSGQHATHWLEDDRCQCCRNICMWEMYSSDRQIPHNDPFISVSSAVQLWWDNP